MPRFRELSERSRAMSREVANGVIPDFDAEGNLVGLDIDQASTKVKLTRLELSGITAEIARDDE